MHAMQQQLEFIAPSILSLAGNCGYSVQDGRVVLTISRIISQRGPGDLSGTLSIELWALRQAYSGGPFSGVALAGTGIGELWGQHFLADCRYDLIFQEPPAGSWHMVLMLREWTGAGYVTRDHVNFALPYLVSPKPSVLRGATDNVIKVDFAPNSDPPVKGVVTQPAPAVPPTKVAAESQGHSGVSLNDASLTDIAGIQGISRRVAESLVAARPFRSFDQVVKVKGIGPALLRKIRQLMTL
jgi:hypothetical protein